MPEPQSHPVFAFVYPIIGWIGERMGFGERRADLLAQASGTIVEIGAGNGLNFRHYPAGAQVLATEPEPHLFKRARRNATRAPVKVRVEQAPADALPVEDASADTVVSTLVLCSVPDVGATLAEIKRVLKPGGRLLVFEHVRSDDPALARKQDKAEPMHKRFAAGCHPNRDTLASLRAAGFDVAAIRPTTLPGSKIASPAIVGAAVKP